MQMHNELDDINLCSLSCAVIQPFLKYYLMVLLLSFVVDG